MERKAKQVLDEDILVKDYARRAVAVEYVRDGILILDREKVILYANPSFLKASEFLIEELIGKKFDLLLNGTDNSRLYRRISEVFSQGKEWKGVYKRQRKDRTTCDIETSIYPIRENNKRISGYVWIETDISEESRLKKRSTRIQKTEALDALASGVAHAFNNILVPILVNTEMALWDVSKDSAAHDYLALSLEAAERGRELIKKIIVFSRPRSHGKKSIDGGLLVRKALDRLKSSLPSNIKIRREIGAKTTKIWADPELIQQVLFNLFSNAVFAMKERGGDLTVRLNKTKVGIKKREKYPMLEPGNFLKFTVSDTGCGISKEIIENIFDPFFTTKARAEGSGMGLSEVHRIIKDHGGGVGVESVEGEGTTFEIYLPLIEMEEEGGGKKAGKGEVDRGDERILLVDDEEVVLRSMENVLRYLGHRVIAKKNARDALKTFRAKSMDFDLVITDQIMPDLSGLELTRKILEIRPDIPIIVSTGFTDKIEENIKKRGIHDLILKPITVSDVARKIRRVLDK